MNAVGIGKSDSVTQGISSCGEYSNKLQSSEYFTEFIAEDEDATQSSTIDVAESASVDVVGIASKSIGSYINYIYILLQLLIFRDFCLILINSV